jgi:hypothetical protein
LLHFLEPATFHSCEAFEAAYSLEESEQVLYFNVLYCTVLYCTVLYCLHFSSIIVSTCRALPAAGRLQEARGTLQQVVLIV